MNKIKVIDSHTAGEPTRVVVDGAPDLGVGNMEDLRDRFEEKAHWLRTALLSEPRGFKAMVGALLCEPTDPKSAAGVIFFNNSGVLKGCIHGTMGLIKTLEFMRRISAGSHYIETPIGIIKAELRSDGSVSVANVPSYRYLSNVEIDVEGFGKVLGDVAWGGNWFYLIEGYGPEIKLSNLRNLSSFSIAAMEALEVAGIVGDNGSKIDHIEIFGPPSDSVKSDSTNFVMCPGGEYDRSPCGTGTSAKLACLHASGKLKQGQIWRQSSILGTVFEGEVKPLEDQKVIPKVSGRAWVNGETNIIIDHSDPFRFGIG
ncbi:MAG TPA: hydroxyproline-2-epimerase [Verrucomicrobia bacterium]|nr:hydroxyproline-2-epimerase [Verrucomicrobiales bacterium]HIL55429.1 hydroxyproline-2-epimerase [Verrucomicrobiota bacterium]